MVIKRSSTVPPRAQPSGKVGGGTCPLVPHGSGATDNYGYRRKSQIYEMHGNREIRRLPWILAFTVIQWRGHTSGVRCAVVIVQNLRWGNGTFMFGPLSVVVCLFLAL